MAASRIRVVVLAAALAGCGSGGGFPDARPIDGPPAMGTFTLSWTISDPSNQPLACSRIGGLSVTVLAHNVAVEGGNTQVFTCDTGMGQSQAMPVGTYELQFELGGSTGLLATAPAQHSVVISANETTALPPIAFVVDATGALQLTLESGKAGGNCATTANGGAGITTTAITLVHTTGGTCEPLTLAISAGATQPARSYTIDCTTPTVAPFCIEHDQMLTATGMPSDAYQIHVRGTAGADCWSNNESIQVPPLGQVLMRTLNLTYAAATACSL